MSRELKRSAAASTHGGLHGQVTQEDSYRIAPYPIIHSLYTALRSIERRGRIPH
jgi:hypothetical protein